MNKESSLSFKNIFKHETKLAAYIIACMSIVVMSVSYALFFQVTNNSKNQVVEAGDLVFTYDNGNEITQDAKNICFQPMSKEEAELYADECAYKFSVTNTGSLKANYSITLEQILEPENEKNEITGDKLQVILKKVEKEGEDATYEDVETFPKKMEDTGTLVLAENIELDSKSTVEYRVQIYVDETTHEDTDVGKRVKYQIHGKGVVHENQPTSTEAQEEVFPNTIIDDQDEAGNGLITQSHEDYAPTGGGSLEEGWKNSELRFVGPDPNNYVEFNNEKNTWRIIGLVNVKTTNGITQRVKIIRDSIGNYSWDTSESGVNSGYGVNEWSESDIMKLLNPGYDEDPSNNSLYWRGESGTCYNAENNGTTGCEFSNIGLSKSQDYISDDIIWNTGSNGNNDYQTGLAKHFYEYERSSNTGKICSSGTFCSDDVPRKTEWKTENDKKALVGLMYPSDYGYATSGGTEPDRNSCLDIELYHWSSNKSCYNNDWLLYRNYPWTLSPGANPGLADFVFFVHYNGYVYSNIAGEPGAVHPVVYLKSNVKIIDGDGSKENNFKLRVG